MDMDKQIKTVNRERPALAQFGGRTWELASVHYRTATLKDKYAEIRVDVSLVHPMNKLAEEMLGRIVL